MTENQVINVQSSSAQVSIPAGSLQVSQVYTIRCEMVNNSAVIAKVSFCIVGFELYIYYVVLPVMNTFIIEKCCKNSKKTF